MGEYPMFKNAVQTSHRLMMSVVRQGDLVLDATCGRGHDTLFLANLVGPEGHVAAMDMQEEALASTRARLEQHGLMDRCSLICDNHKNLERHITRAPSVIAFNLGYLPGGNKGIVTNPADTLTALAAALKVIKGNGMVTIVYYMGHPGGKLEYDSLRTYLTSLPQQHYEAVELMFVNQVHNPPGLWAVQRLNGGRL